MGEGQPDLALHVLIGAIGQLAVGDRREPQDHVARLLVLEERRVTLPIPGDRGARDQRFVVQISDRIVRPVRTEAIFAHLPPEGDELVVNVLVVAGNHLQTRHSDTGHGVHFPSHPVLHIRLGDFGRSIVGQRHSDEIANRLW